MNTLELRKQEADHILYKMLSDSNVDVNNTSIIDIWRIFRAFVLSDFHFLSDDNLIYKDDIGFHLYRVRDAQHSPSGKHCCLSFSYNFELKAYEKLVPYDDELWDLSYNLFFDCLEVESLDKAWQVSSGYALSDELTSSNDFEEFVQNVENLMEFRVLSINSSLCIVKPYVEVQQW